MLKATIRTKRTIYAVAALMAIALAVVTVDIAPSQAQAPPPILAEPLTPRSVFPDQASAQFRNKLSGHGTDVVNMKDLSRTIVVRFTVQPGARFPWHTHPGLVVVNVAQGELVYVTASDCVERPYPAGTAFVDPGHGHVHTAFNRTGGVTVLYATFFDFPETGPLSITEGIEEPDCDVGP
jgi:hypothetical protein